MTLSQCRRVIDNGFLGESRKVIRKDGTSSVRQVDYNDYKDEILAHYYSIADRGINEYVEAPDFVDDITVDIPIKLRLGVTNNWRYIAYNLKWEYGL